MLVAARVFQQQDAAGRTALNGFADARRDGHRRLVEPIVHQRHFALHDFADAAADFGQRLLGLAADVAEDDLLPALLATELERLAHRSQADVPFADFWSRLGVDVTAHQHRRALRQVGQRRQTWNGREQLAELALRPPAAHVQQRLTPMEHRFGGYAHFIVAVSAYSPPASVTSDSESCCSYSLRACSYLASSSLAMLSPANRRWSFFGRVSASCASYPT